VITLVLGGARSGKSAVAERRASALAGDAGGVTYVATAIARGDADLAARIRAHQDRRPPQWTTVEAGADLVGALDSLDENTVALVDSLGTWVGAQPDLAVDIDGFVATLRTRSGPSVLVSDEVGLGVHPSTEAGLRFRDALGELNLAIAEVAHDVLLVVAGRVLPVERP
jgi:adenosyl cobinamide kinase/adenosyl cobinamide phosphate guanylyltransferase